jgi:hypothetical protein
MGPVRTILLAAETPPDLPVDRVLHLDSGHLREDRRA